MTPTYQKTGSVSHCYNGAKNTIIFIFIPIFIIKK